MRGVAHLVVHGRTGSTSYETIPPVRLETSGDVLSTVDMVVQRRDGPRWLRDHDDDDDSVSAHALRSVHQFGLHGTSEDHVKCKVNRQLGIGDSNTWAKFTPPHA